MAKRKETVLEELSRVRFIGEKMAKALYDDHGARTIEDIVELGDQGALTELRGVGNKKASTILSSAKRLASAAKKAEKAEKEKADAEEDVDSNGAVPDEEPVQRTNGRAREPAKPSRPSAGRAAAAGAAGGPSTARPATAPTPSVDEARQALKQRFIDTLRCPACGHDRFDLGASTLTCQACQRQFNLKNDIADLAPPVTPSRSLSQKVMETRLYTQFYEEFMRPRLTGLVSNRTMRDEYRLAAEFLDFGGNIRLLDVGCGTGNFTRYFAQRIGLAESRVTDPDLPLVVGMDLSWPMLENARRNIRQENLDGKVYLLRGDATRIPVRRGAFNRLHCGGSLHLMSDIDEGLRNFARVLEPDGICVIGTFILGKGILRRLLKRVAEFPTQFHWFSRDELHRRIERAGFEILDDSLAGDAITVKARRI